MSKKIIAGIDIGTSITRIALAEYNKHGQPPAIIGVGSNESRGLRHGYPVNIIDVVSSIKKAIKDTEKNTGFDVKQALISIGGTSLSSETALGSVIISRADGEIMKEDIIKAIEASEESLSLINRKIIHRIPIAYKLDNKEVLGKPEGMHGIKLEVKTLFITCLKQHLEDLILAVTEAGVEVVDVIAAPLAASFVALTERQKTVGCALVNIGAETVTVAVFENNNIISLQVFPIGSNDITNDIALGLRISLEEAEGIKTGTLIRDYSRKKLDEIIKARLTDIFVLVENHLKKIKRNELLPAGIILTGGGVNLNIIEEMSRELLNLPSKIGGLNLANYPKNKIKDSSYFVASGLCLLGNLNQIDERGYFSFNKTGKQVKNFFTNLFSQLMP